jgi:uncharacterized membrane protein
MKPKLAATAIMALILMCILPLTAGQTAFDKTNQNYTAVQVVASNASGTIFGMPPALLFAILFLVLIVFAFIVNIKIRKRTPRPRLFPFGCTR